MTEVSGFRASPQQIACWALQQGMANHPYWSMLQLQLHGVPDTGNLAGRLQELAGSEEILRTRPYTLPGMQAPIQHIEDSAALALHQEDLRGMPGEMQEAHLARLLENPSEDGANLHAILSRTAEDRHVLTLRAPASTADLASLHLLANRLLAPGQAAAALQYADYAEWKAGLLEEGESSAGVQYWRQRRADPAPSPELGMHATAGEPLFVPRRMALAQPASAAILRQCEELGCTPEQWLAGAWALLLARLGGLVQLDLALLDASRGEGLDDAIGPYEQALPVRCTVDFGQAMPAHLQAMRTAISQAGGWRDYFDSAQSPAYAFAWHAMPAAPRVPGLAIAVRHQQSVARRFSLCLEAWQQGLELQCRLTYDASLWQDGALACLAEQWQLLVASLAAEPARLAGAVSLHGRVQRALTQGERAPETDAAGIVQLIERWAAATPDAPALADAAATLSYAELNLRANRLAHKLLRAGVAPGEVVGISLARGNDMVVAILAVLKAGAAYLPLDPAYPAERLDFMVRDSGARHVIGRTFSVNELPADGAAEANPAPPADLESPAYLIYTSGSSGQPKAVEVSHRSLARSTRTRMAFYDAPVRVFLLLSSFSFDSSVAGIFWTLAQGGKLVLPASGDELALDVLCHLIERHGVSHSLSLPSLYGALLMHAPAGLLQRLDTWIVAGEACPAALVVQHHAVLPHARLVNEYGPTEGGVWATAETLAPTDGPVSIGRPIPGMVLELVNEYGVPCAVGEPGEICLAGPQLATGYRGHPELTAAAFASLPGVAGGQRLYRTGDLARWDARGKLHFLGRRDHQVKIRGHRVELAEIERQLQSHAEIAEAVVVAQEHIGGKRLLAYFTVRNAHAPDDGALRNYLEARMPAYMVPSAFIALPAIPLTPNGKRDLNALPDPAQAQVRGAYVAPRTALERELADICASVLRLPRMGVHDNFFHAGGDSILSLQVVTRANQAGIALTTRQVFERQTVEAMAAVARRSAGVVFACDVGWLQSLTGQQELSAFALGQEHNRLDAGEVLATALSHALQAAPRPVALLRLHDSGAGHYMTRHQLPARATDVESALHEARAALRTESDQTGAADAILYLREQGQGQAALAQDLPAQAPLRAAATLMPQALTLALAADSGHYSEEALQQIAAGIAQQLNAMARHWAAAPTATPRAQDFAAAGLDQDALDDLLAELGSANS